MSKKVTKAADNRYCKARLKAATYNSKFLTRAGAVEELPGVSEDCLKKWELGINKPPNIAVMLMADAYNEPELRTWYCANECPLGMNCREVPEMPPERVVLRIQNAIALVDKPIKDLSKILEDGFIDEEEQKELPLIREDMLELKHRLDELLVVIEKNTKEQEVQYGIL